ncbi:hypothetical protein N5C36_19275 [Shewanella xiamenensis]|uniref:hypothetical protein n=1 Tax=Shewanella xiamenensis TaxID=332186 RepID=UPI0024472BFF|nr:hypothetical protein [Shewanella xiamenensis]MDH1316215.1 hypothetical protein [Shewanella xiamenensis]
MVKVCLSIPIDIFDAQKNEPSTIYLRNKFEKNKPERNNTAIACNRFFVFDGLHYIPSEEFMYKNKDSKSFFMVLTDRELLNIEEYAVRYNVKVCSLESYYPFLSDIKYNDDLKINFDYLLETIRYVKSLGFKGHSFSKEVTKNFRKTLLNKIFMKSEYDSKFYFSYSGPCQEVFRFCEKREDRTIVALDFNSMFASCLQGEFINPKGIEFKSIKSAYDGRSELPHGIYKVFLSNPKSSFIRNYHPFRLIKDFKRYPFSLSGINEIETILHKEEIEYYSSHFSNIWIDTGYVSISNIGHPLYKSSTVLYKKRLRSKNQGKKTLEKKYKLKLAMLHSITNSKCFKSKIFSELNQISRFLRMEFGVNLDFSNKNAVKNFFKSSHFSLIRKPQGFLLRHIDIYSKFSIYSLSSQVMAKVRVKMLTLLEELLSIEKVELCYINTDCVHVSFPKIVEECFWQKIEHLVGDELGKLKVEAVADSGYWFDVGRYFLYKNNKVIKFSNSGLNHRGNSKPFLLTKPILTRYESENFLHITKEYSHFSNLLSYSKKLEQMTEYSDYVRFTAAQILDATSIISLEQSERENSSKIKSVTYLSLMQSYNI